jgi:hypothetical protein
MRIARVVVWGRTLPGADKPLDGRRLIAIFSQMARGPSGRWFDRPLLLV